MSQNFDIGLGFGFIACRSLKLEKKIQKVTKVTRFVIK